MGREAAIFFGGRGVGVLTCVEGVRRCPSSWCGQCSCGLSRDTVPLMFAFQREREMGSKSQEYKELFEKIDQEEDGEVYLRYKTVHMYNV